MYLKAYCVPHVELMEGRCRRVLGAAGYREAPPPAPVPPDPPPVPAVHVPCEATQPLELAANLEGLCLALTSGHEAFAVPPLQELYRTLLRPSLDGLAKPHSSEADGGLPDEDMVGASLPNLASQVDVRCTAAALQLALRFQQRAGNVGGKPIPDLDALPDLDTLCRVLTLVQTRSGGATTAVRPLSHDFVKNCYSTLLLVI
jgi:hypothetical protein